MDKLEKVEFRPLYLEICGLPYIYNAHHQWLVGQALARKIAGYLCLEGAKYGTSKSIVQQRNDLVKRGLQTNATHFVFVDWDVIPPVDAIQILHRHDKDIVGGVYYSKDEFDKPMILKKKDKYEFYQGKGLEKVDVLSAGLTLVKREVYEKIEFPWYCHDTFKQTEDIYFCEKAKEAGYEVWADFDLIADHVGVFSNRDIKLKNNKEFINKL